MTPELLTAAVRELDVSPTVLPLEVEERVLDPERLAKELGALKYPGFAYMKYGRLRNPFALLLEALSAERLEARLVEALPWLLVKFDVGDHHDDLVREARARAVQNRLGFVAELALELLAKNESHDAREREQHLRKLVEELGQRPLANEDTFLQGELSDRQKDWLRENRPEAAGKWNLLTDWRAEHLGYAA